MRLSTEFSNGRLFSELLGGIVCGCLVCSFGTAGDWAQFRGPNRDGISSETGLATSWPAGGPALLWSASGIGEGYAHPSIAKGVLYITGVREKKEFVSAFDLKGTKKWDVEYGNAWARNFSSARCSPTIDGDSLFIISGVGEVVRLDVTSGKKVWSVDAKTQFGGTTHPWGTAEAPLVVDGKVIYTPAGPNTAMVALDRETGKTVWKTESMNDKAAYVSPILVNHKGTDMIIGGTADYIFGVAPADGRILWRFKYGAESAPKSGSTINCNSPIYHDGGVFITSGYNHVGVMLALDDAGKVSKAWVSTDLDTHHGGVVLVDGYLYGSNWINNRQGNWLCVDWNTGETKYEQTWQTKGAIISAEGMLYCYDEKGGNVGLAKASADGFSVVSSFAITQGEKQHWCHPAISDGVLYIRHGDALMAYDIKAK